jgi:dihydrofolate synthase/folylpolyglutamate synthase
LAESDTAGGGYRHALDLLWRRSSYERGFITDPFGSRDAGLRGLRRVRALLARLGDPDRAFRVVHVAGSKGKGSTAAMIAAALQATGHRVGLYTSPHLHSFRERIAVDGEGVSPAAFADLAARVETMAIALETEEPDLGTVSTFEFLTAMGLLAFAEAGCAAAVVEVGLGGELDATNVVDPLVSVITRMDLEHTTVLGDSLPEIAAAKAGIVKPGRPVALGANPADVVDVVDAAARRSDSLLLQAGRDFSGSGLWTGCTLTGPWGSWTEVALALPGAHQVENAATAAAALWLAGEAGLESGESAARAGFARVRWPGRFEQLTVAGVRVVLDGAHTPAAAAAIARAMAATFPGESAVAVVGMFADKDAGAILTALRPVVSTVVATAAAAPRATAPDIVAAAARDAGIPVETAASVAAAVARGQELARREARPLLITGSIYLVGEAREALGLAVADPPWGPISD